MGLLGRRSTPQPSTSELYAARLTDGIRIAGGLPATVTLLPPWRLRRSPAPAVLLGAPPACAVILLAELEQLGDGKVGVAETAFGYPTAFVSDLRAVAPDSAVGEVVTGVAPGHVVFVTAYDGPVRLEAVLTLPDVTDLVTWARAITAT